jgi:prolyl-tRNA synthetase
LEKAVSLLEPVAELEPTADKPEEIHTPGMGAIADIAAFLKMSPANDIKCVAYMGFDVPPSMIDGDLPRPIAVFLRGDHQVNETKLMAATGTVFLRPMDQVELERYFHGPAGFLGPVGLRDVLESEFAASLFPTHPSFADGTAKRQTVKLFRDSRHDSLKTVVVLDRALEGRRNMVCGANRLDYHLRNVTQGRDFTWTLAADIRSVNEGENCPATNGKNDGCAGKLVVGRAVEVGHIFKLGDKYTKSMGARVLDENGKEVTPIMGCYGIGIERILTAAIEQANDANGFCLAASIAPFTVVVTVTNVGDAALRETGERIAAELETAGLDVLLDDRDERAGVKFKDADLVGIPYRINVGKKAAAGQVELVTRSTSTSVDVGLNDVVAQVKKRVAEEQLLASSS